MKKQIFILLACTYILATAVAIVLSLNTVFHYQHEHAGVGQETLVSLEP